MLFGLFRSRKRWVTPASVIPHHGPVPIYFAVTDSGSIIQYEGQLVDVQLDPSPNNPKTQEFLQHSGDTTETEGLWDDTVRTLYLVRGCKELSQPFPQNELLKFHGGAALEPTYIRAYALVRRRTGAV